MNEENKYGYIYEAPKPSAFVFGDAKLGDASIQPDGQWDASLPEVESQAADGFETEACVTEMTEHATEILEKKKYGNAPHYSVRFLATQSGTGVQHGNTFGNVAETLRKGGCVLETDYPFAAPDLATFYQTPPQNIIYLARVQFADDSFGYSFLPNTSPATIMAALTYSPVGVSLWGWAPPDADGIYHRPPGTQDIHATLITGYEPGQFWKIRDSYPPYDKKLAWDYGFGQGIRFTIDRIVPTTPKASNGWQSWSDFVSAVGRILSNLYNHGT